MKKRFIFACITIIMVLQVSFGQSSFPGFQELSQASFTSPFAGWQGDGSFAGFLSGDTLLVIDDGSAETGWGISPNKMGWLGNYFPVSSSLSGHIDSAYVLMLNNSAGSGPTLTVDIFNSNHELQGSSSTFTASPGSWLSVPIPSVSFTGPFYAMLKWDHFTAQSHWLGYDINGSFATQNYERYCDSTGIWTNLQIVAGALPGVFMIRIKASNTSNGTMYDPYHELPLLYPNPAVDRVNITLQQEIYGVVISDLTGSEKLTVPVAGLKQLMLDVSSLPEGVYLIKIQTKKSVHTSKLIIRR